ncbi:hypothetical protein [Sinomicrobium sp.]
MKKTCFFYLCLSLTLLWSCEQETPHAEVSADDAGMEETVTVNASDSTAISFAKALAGAMHKSETLRIFLKEEALQMFNNDYDVLYHAVKDEQLADGSTFAALLAEERGEDKEAFAAILEGVPGLTVFVPSLPMDTFSAHNWNTSTQIPWVAVALSDGEKVYYVSGTGEEEMAEAKMIPAFPVVVVKENERVITGEGLYSSTAKSMGVTVFRGGVNYRFLDEVFDGSLRQNDKQRTMAARQISSPDQKLKEAYEVFEGTNGWHRDYIYYGMTPDTTEGEFSYDYQEHISFFAMKGGEGALGKVSDQDDDPMRKISYNPSDPDWTDGFLEFKVSVLINARNGIGDEYITYFSAAPDDLFEMNYESRCGSSGFFKLFYCPEFIGFKELQLNLPLFQWDLNQYASSIKIAIEEVDLEVTTTITDTRTVKFANNFDIQGDVLKKIGLKFGAKLETTESQSIKKTFTQGNDQLGEVIVNFADKVLLGKEDENWKTREYETGWYRIGVAPRRVQ